MHRAFTPGRLLVPVAAFVAAGLAFASPASAQELVGAELSATVPTVVMGSSAARMARIGEPVVTLRGPRWAVCDPSGNDCYGLRPHTIFMNVFPHWSLHVNLPHNFAVHGHLWTMSHDAVDVSLKQAIVGPTLRHKSHGRWIEVGFGFAERAVAQSDEEQLKSAVADGAGAVGRLGAALIGGLGMWVDAGEHMVFDFRLRGGMGVGDRGEGIYHANFVVAFAWR
jgi:hypothetical protein